MDADPTYFLISSPIFKYDNDSSSSSTSHVSPNYQSSCDAVSTPSVRVNGDKDSTYATISSRTQPTPQKFMSPSITTTVRVPSSTWHIPIILDESQRSTVPTASPSSSSTTRVPLRTTTSTRRVTTSSTTKSTKTTSTTTATTTTTTSTSTTTTTQSTTMSTTTTTTTSTKLAASSASYTSKKSNTSTRRVASPSSRRKSTVPSRRPPSPSTSSSSSPTPPPSPPPMPLLAKKAESFSAAVSYSTSTSMISPWKVDNSFQVVLKAKTSFCIKNYSSLAAQLEARVSANNTSFSRF